MEIYKKKEFDKILNSIKNNKLVILPTDTQMAIICKNPEKIYNIKNRDKSKKLIKFIYDIDDYDVSEEFKILANNFFPGKITLIENDISYRIPKNKLLLKILKYEREIYSSSANISGEEPINNSLKYLNKFDPNFKKELVLVVGKTWQKKPSTIYNLDKYQIIRKGKIKEKKIKKILNKYGKQKTNKTRLR